MNEYYEVPSQLKPFLKPAYTLFDQKGVHVYNEQYKLIGIFTPPSGDVQNDSVDLKNRTVLGVKLSQYDLNALGEANAGGFSPPSNAEIALEDLNIGHKLPEKHHNKVRRERCGLSLRHKNTFFIMDENYVITDRMQLTNIPEEEGCSRAPVKDEDFERKPVVSLKYDIEMGGRRYAKRQLEDFFLIHDETGAEIFEYFTQDEFVKVDTEHEVLIFKEKDTGALYGKALDGRRVCLDQIKRQRKTKTQPKPIPPDLIESPADKLVEKFSEIISQLKIKAEEFLMRTTGPGFGDQLYSCQDHKDIPFEIKASLIYHFYGDTILRKPGMTEQINNGSDLAKRIKKLFTYTNLIDEKGNIRQKQYGLKINEQKNLVRRFKEKGNQFSGLSKITEKVYKEMTMYVNYCEAQQKNTKIGLELFKSIILFKLYRGLTVKEAGQKSEVISLTKEIMKFSA